MHATGERVDAWAALGDATRRSILEILAQRPDSVREIASRVPVTRSAVSQHLRVLKEAGLVVSHRAGSRRIYRIDIDGMSAIRRYLDQFWNEPLAAYKAATEDPREEPR
jgi:DNA-binding transcriptional ArsR family regulator